MGHQNTSTIYSTNPTTGKTGAPFTPATGSQIEHALSQAHTTFPKWGALPLSDRQKLIENLGDLLEQSSEHHARQMVEEMGKTIIAARAEIEKCVQYCRYMAKMSQKYLADTPVKTQYQQSFTRALPLGVILLVMPWNFPYWQVIRVAVPALLAGNVCILKQAESIPNCAQSLEQLFSQAGFPACCFKNIFADISQTHTMISDPRIAGVSVTGSLAAGRSIGALCGQHIKKSVLELGGADPFIVTPSADLDAAVEAALTSRLRNNGQSCIAAKRMIIHAHIYDKFKQRYLHRLNQINIGDPMLETTDLGPLVHKGALKIVEAMIQKAQTQGAVLTKSNHTLPANGFFIAPAILEKITPQMDIYNQEIFAPIALFFKADNFDHAIALANDTPFGLSSVLFSGNKTEINRAMNEINAGSTFINRYSSSDIRLPFGGTKLSGYGREMAKAGLREFTNLKTVIVAS